MAVFNAPYVEYSEKYCIFAKINFEVMVIANPRYDIGQTEIKQKSEWIESLTHDGYFVQIPLIKGKPRTSLEKLLSIFERDSQRLTFSCP